MACPNERLSLRQTDESNAATQQPAHAIRGVMSREAVSLVSGVLHRLAPSRMQLVDTVKMIAYRAETAMTSVVREALARGDDARSLLRDLFRSATDLVPDLEQQLLGVEVHPMSNPRSNRAIAYVLHLLKRLRLDVSGHQLAPRLLARGDRRFSGFGSNAEKSNFSTTESRRSGGLSLRQEVGLGRNQWPAWMLRVSGHPAARLLCRHFSEPAAVQYSPRGWAVGRA